MTQKDYKAESNSFDDKVKKFSLWRLDNPTMDGAAERNNWFLFWFLWRLGEQAIDPGINSEVLFIENDANQIQYLRHKSIFRKESEYFVTLTCLCLQILYVCYPW